MATYGRKNKILRCVAHRTKDDHIMNLKRCSFKDCHNMAKYGHSNIRIFCYSHNEKNYEYKAKEYCKYQNCEKKLLKSDKDRGDHRCEEHKIES